MPTPVAFMFSGKGSQYFNMGSDLYRDNRLFRHHIDRLDDVAKATTGINVVDRVFDLREQASAPIADPLLAVLAIYLVECALARTLIDSGILPDAIVTASMGIYAGAVIAGVLSEEAGFRYLHQTSRVFREVCEPGRIRMVQATPEQFVSSGVLTALSELAAISFDTHITISFPRTHEPDIDAELKRLDMTSYVLPISRAYHSHWIDVARRPFLDLFGSEQSGPLAVPLNCISGNFGLAQFSGTAVWQAVRRPMYFQRSIEQMERQGSWRYVDVGPASSSATLLKYCLPKSTGSSFYPLLMQFPGDSARLNHVLALHT